MTDFCRQDSGLTEITEIKEGRSQDRSGGLETVAPRHEPLCGWILYDGDCRSCIASARTFERLFRRRGFRFLPLQTPWVQKRLGLEPNAPLEEMRVLARGGGDLGGADAVIFLARQIWWAWPLYALAQLPGMHRVADRSYRWIAAHRGCTHISCATPRVNRWPAWLGLVLLPTLAVLARNRVAPWAFMWLMAAAIFLGCKWLTFWRALRHGAGLHLERLPGYFVFWAGMDAANFLSSDTSRGDPSRHIRTIILAAAKILCGTFALFVFARLVSNPLLAGWIGMIGMILILHFGLFDLAAVAWRIAGVDAKPIMNAPIKATSLNEFWGRRWNGAFNQLLLDLFFRRYARSIGTAWATLIAFLISGLIHELVISVPARGGYGLPTAYFLLQGCGVIVQRAFRIRRGFTGWLFTMLIAAGPAFWLFHPPFVRHVILPFMQAIHAL
jgi:predicted DCC family thiol-disulfide oxidoreductase YuxK